MQAWAARGAAVVVVGPLQVSSHNDCRRPACVCVCVALLSIHKTLRDLCSTSPGLYAQAEDQHQGQAQA